MTSTVTDDRRVNRLLEWLEKQRQDYADMVTDAGDASLWCKEEAELIRDHIKTVEDMRDHTRALSVDVKETPVHYQQAGLSLTDATQAPQADPVREAAEMPRAWLDVMGERVRQIAVEGWDDIHDDCNDRGELAQAAACYALSGTPADEAVYIHGRWNDPRDLFWPWDRSWWKPTNRRRNLVKAGALILAEIERLDRALASQNKEASDGR